MGSWSALNVLGPVRTAHVHLRANLRCTWCDRRTVLGRRHVDHVVPRAEGGSDDLSNLVLACRDCNIRRSPGMLPPRARDAGRTRAQVRTEIERQVAILCEGPARDLALVRARMWWPDQFARREKARAAYLDRQADAFDFGFAEVA